ncbi:hypothetical protein F4820DRAFT_444240 [Hypoxylon rubiginosum]|uniref:Uncharacterized protein n=1 Tax=Hypoxylon rubiginosum TaxID=110542 RepID=A0ACB9ZCU8_9PEZI|nr:hypothetical protein F4820DRAFT_444240 [Hypoxylon rubiginosum]
MQFNNAALFLSVLWAALAILLMTSSRRPRHATYPFRTQGIEGSDNKNLQAFGYGTCIAESGVLDCCEPEGAPAIFTNSGADLKLIGSGIAFSANSIPNSGDTARSGYHRWMWWQRAILPPSPLCFGSEWGNPKTALSS